jgi:transcriptional regulator with XRE-family HTH domain
MPTDEATNDMRPIDREMGARLRSTRQVLGIGQQILAKKVGVSFQQIQKFAKGINRLSAGMLVRICQSLEASPMEILGAYFQDQRPSGNRMVWLQEKLLTAERKLSGVRRALRDK